MSAGIDWADGHYEMTAETLRPATAAALGACGIRPGEMLLDVGAGTGNAAIAAARAGARVVAVDPADRLLDVARVRAADEGLAIETRTGSADALPVGDGAFDAVLSVFGVIFAPDGPGAVAELVRATRPGGRIVLTAWTREGAIFACGRLLREAMTTAQAGPESGAPGPAGPARMATDWSDEAAVAGLFAPHPVMLATSTATLTFRAADPAAWFAQAEEQHPVWRAGRRALDPDAWDGLRARSLEALAAANEDPAAFAVTSTYRIVRADLAG